MNQPAIVDNPFGAKVPVAASNNAVAASEAERATQEVQAALVIAKKFPRNSVEAMERIINACTRPTLAAGALYSYPRGGQEITGPSIRLAEAMAQEWGNMQFGIRELSAENGSSTVEAFAWDVETNTRQVKIFQVEHARFARGQLKRLKDPRDIYELIANQGARRLRACILGVIPGDVTEAAVRQCEVTQASTVEVNPESIQSMLSAFADNYSVSQELIEKRIGKRAEAINAAQMLNLKKIYQSLKDGMSKAPDWFDIDVAEQPATTASNLNQELAGGDRKEPAEKKPAKPKEVDEVLDIPGQQPTPATATQIVERFSGAQTLQELASMLEHAQHLVGPDSDPESKAEVTAAYQARQKELQAAHDADPVNQ